MQSTARNWFSNIEFTKKPVFIKIKYNLNNMNILIDSYIYQVVSRPGYNRTLHN